MQNNTLAIALASLLVGGVAVAAFQNSHDNRTNFTTATPGTVNAPTTANANLAAGDMRAQDGAIPASGRVEYAQVVNVDPINAKQKLYSQVLGPGPVREPTIGRAHV